MSRLFTSLSRISLPRRSQPYLLCGLLALWITFSAPVLLLAQSAPPVNGGWPAGLSYTVQPDDTLLTASLEMGMDLEQMACLLSRSFSWDQPLVVGKTLTVPDKPFFCHRVQPGDTLTLIATTYGVTILDIVAEPWNLAGSDSTIHYLRIPLRANDQPANAQPHPIPSWGGPFPMGTGGESPVALPPPPSTLLPLPAYWPYGSGHFAWPVYGWITQGFRASHSAIDVGAWEGTPVTAADRGVVIRAGWSTLGYGNFVVIDHKIDYITLYAHLDEIFVGEGDVVAQGQLIGTVGSTGNSTGPHLHFEIRDFGRRVDPLSLLGR